MRCVECGRKMAPETPGEPTEGQKEVSGSRNPTRMPGGVSKDSGLEVCRGGTLGGARAVGVAEIGDDGLLRCHCGGEVFEVRWVTRVRPGRTRASLVDQKKLLTCTACNLSVAAKQVIREKEKV